jgi:hypothetical protein
MPLATPGGGRVLATVAANDTFPGYEDGDSGLPVLVKASALRTYMLDVGTVVADAAALTSAQITGGESPTEAEHNALQTDVAAIRTKLNAVIDALQGMGLIDAA